MSTQLNASIVYRINGGKSVVQASAIQDVEDLAFGIGFLANHRLYKMSKSPEGVTLANAQEVAKAFLIAAERFHNEITAKLGGEKETTNLSALGVGDVENPFCFVETARK